MMTDANGSVVKSWAAGPMPALQDLAALETRLHLAKQAQLKQISFN